MEKKKWNKPQVFDFDSKKTANTSTSGTTTDGATVYSPNTQSSYAPTGS